MESIHVRCPSCSKLYIVDANEIRTDRPQFECVSCKTRFWFSFPVPPDVREPRTFRVGESPAADSQTGAPVQISQIPSLAPLKTEARKNTEIPRESFLCPKCRYANALGSIECISCGVVFERARQKATGVKINVDGSKDLKYAWDSVINDYDNMGLHESFIQKCLAERNLPFASQQYRIILEANPNDDVALRMRDKIINVATLTYVPPRRHIEPKKRISIPGFLIIVGGILMALGLVFVPMRTIIPIGAVFCSVGIGFHFINKNRV